jgi:hypothetical protein
MKNITLSADEHLVERARAVARERHTTLNNLFRDWLNSLTPSDQRVREFEQLMDDLGSRVSTGGKKFSREELNER